MNRRVSRWVAVAAAAAGLGLGPAPEPAPKPAPAQPPRVVVPPLIRLRPTDQVRTDLEEQTRHLGQALAKLPRETPSQRDAWADAAVYQKAADWALRLGEFFDSKDVAATRDLLERGRERARQLAEGRKPWATARGSVARGYVSRVDGSVQPFVVIVPEGLAFSAERRARLDVVLHGRNAKLSEARFLRAHDSKPTPEGASNQAITLHVFGRGNNAYRWAGEADVFEAIDAVKRNFPIDEERVVLRGFSMGGAGAWHLGLHHPAVWASVEAGAGFTETKNYLKQPKLTAVQEKALHIYDAVDYALNACDVPIAGYGGENDPQKQAALNVENALRELGFAMKTEGLVTRGEGIDFLRVLGAGTGHKVDPESRKVLDAWHDAHAARGVDLNLKRIRFVTYTLKYSRAEWLSIEQMGEHYRKALVDAEIEGDRVNVKAVENVAVLAVDRHVAETITLGRQEFPLAGAVKGLLPNVYFRLADGKWEQLDYNLSRAFEENAERGKRRNLQGPIDDAFTRPFLCVRGTGTPWNPKVQAWADARLERFADDWRRWLRGEVRVKDDTDVTDDDIEENSLILFGDPDSNLVLARVVKGLPLGWTRDEVRLGGRFPAADHAPVLIAPNPLNVHHYVVVNSGHTFGADAFAGSNALLYPSLGDFAVFAVDGEGSEPKVSGFFDEKWKLKENP